MYKANGMRLYVSSSGKVYEDWEVGNISWTPLCWDKSYAESLVKAGGKYNVWTSPRYSAVISHALGWSEVCVEYRMPEGYEDREE